MLSSTPRRPLLPRRGGPRHGPGTRADAGFTLVEVLAAGVILSVVCLCSVKAWTVFDRLSLDMLERQKAAFVLNGEMERLWTVYTSTSYGANDHARSDYPAVAGLPATSNTRVSYEATTATTGFTTTSGGTFANAAMPDATVFLGSGSPPLNWVWLDQPRGLVARLSWTVCQIKASNNDLQPCWGIANSNTPPPKPPPGITPFACAAFDGSPPPSTSSCELITAVLEYPYAFNPGNPQPVGTTRTLTLSTIVGRRI